MTRIWSPWDQNLTNFLSYWRYGKENLYTKFVILVKICRCLYINHWQNAYKSLRIHLAKFIALCPKDRPVYNEELTKMMLPKLVKMRRLWHGFRQSFCCLSSPREGARMKIYDIKSKSVKQKQCPLFSELGSLKEPTFRFKHCIFAISRQCKPHYLRQYPIYFVSNIPLRKTVNIFCHTPNDHIAALPETSL